MLPSADTTFDYGALPTEKAASARAAAERIRLRMTRAAQDIIEVGKDLREQKRALGHGNFLPWIQAEFEMSEWTARNFMNVSDKFGKTGIIPDLTPTALYALAAPATSEEVRTEVIERVAAGEKVTARDIEAMRRKLTKAEEAIAEKESQRRAQEARAAIADKQAREAASRAMFAEADKQRLADEVEELHEEIDRLKEPGVITQWNDAFVAAPSAPTPWTDEDAELRTLQAVWGKTSIGARVQFMQWAGLTSLSADIAA